MIDVHGEATVTCRIDLDDLRAARSDMSDLAFPARLRTQLFPKVYEKAEAYPLDHWRETPIQTRHEGLDFSRQVVQQEQAGGLTLAPPEERLSFRAAVIQPVLHEIPDPEHRDEAVARNRDRLIELIESHVGEGTKLFQLPEFCMQAMPSRKTAPVWYDLCVEVPGPDTAALQELAAKHGIYIAFGALEKDVDRPRRWYNGNFLIDPSGEIVLKNRATHHTSASGTFGDYSDADHIGPDYDWRRLLPVADTHLGRIGLVIGHEILIHEVIRALVFNGAEIIGPAAGEPNMESTPGWTAVKRLRALEYHAYVLTANSGGIRGSALGEARFPGLSAIIDYSGNTMVSIDTPGASSISVQLNMRGLRRRRAEPRSYLAQIKPGLYPEAYRSIAGFPIDLPEGESPAEVEPGKYPREVVRRLETTGTY